MGPERRRASWWFAGALVACVLLGSGIYVWLFVVDAVTGELTRSIERDATVRLRARRTFPAFPWLPEADLVVAGPRGEWRTSVLSPPRDRSGRIAARGAYALRDGAFFVRDGDRWRAHELATGALVPLARLAPIAGVVPVITRAGEPLGTAHGIEAATGEERWAIDAYSPGCCAPVRLAAFGTTEIIVGDRFVDAATGARRPPDDRVYAVDDLADEVVWLEGTPPTLVRRRAGGPARRVLDAPLAAGVEILARGDQLVIVLHRNTEWAPGVARRERFERVAVDDIHARDETAILALADDDSVRWALASAGSLDDSCVLTDPAALRVELELVASSSTFERRACEIDLARGAVSDVARPCPSKGR